MPWTSLEDEADFISDLAQSDRVEVDVVGNSIEGRPIRLLRIGDPPPPPTGRAAILHIGTQHANEFAQREALLQWAEYLANTADSGETAYLATHSVQIMPTANPDGVAVTTRQNAAGVDLNRDHIALSQPETRAMASVQRRARPAILVDHHESTFTNTDGNEVALMPVSSAAAIGFMVDAGILDVTDEILTAMHARAATEGWVHGDWPAIGDERRLTRMAWLRHSAAIVIETLGLGSFPQPEQDRIDQHLAMCEEILAYAMANDVVSESQQAAIRKTAEGAAGNQAFNLRVATINPPPLGYRLTTSQLATTATHRELHDIAMVSSDTISMAQPAQPVIPFLLDASAQFNIVDGQRLFELDEGPGPLPPSDALPIGIITPTVTWLGCDLVTGRIIADLPDITGQISRLLGAYTSSSLQLPIPLSGPGALGSLAFQATVPGRTMIVAIVNDLPAWAGLVLTRRAGTAATMDLATVTLEGYFSRRVVRDHIWTQQDESSVIAAGLAGDAGTIFGVGSGIGLEIDARPTGRLRDREYLETDRATVFDRLQELMAVRNGPEWTIELFWGDATQTWVRKVLRVRDRIGVASPEPQAIFETTSASVFSSVGASESRYEYSEDYSSGRGANYIVAYSSGEGDDQPHSAPAVAADLLAAGWPIYEQHWQPASNISRISTLNNHAERELELKRNGARTWQIDARWNVYPRLNIDWRLGDTIAWQLVGHRHPEGVTGQGRCIGWDLEPQAGTVKPILLDPISNGGG